MFNTVGSFFLVFVLSLASTYIDTPHIPLLAFYFYVSYLPTYLLVHVRMAFEMRPLSLTWLHGYTNCY